MANASGVEKKLVCAVQSAQGTIAAVDAATAHRLRRVTSTLDIARDSYQSAEIRTDRQNQDMRLGLQSVAGTISGELSPATYKTLMAAILRKDWVAGVADPGNTGVAAAATTGAAGTFTRDDAQGNWLEDGFKVGDVVRQTGWTTTATANNTHNFIITAVTATVMTVTALDGVPPVTKVKGDTVITTVAGKKLWVPSTAHTEDWLTIEHYFSDLDLSENFWDCKVNSMALKMPGNGMSTVDFGIMGLQRTGYATGSSPYFSNPTADTTTGIAAAANGLIFVGDQPIAIITGMNIDVAGNLSFPEGAVGSTVLPGIFGGRVTVSGSMTLYLTDFTFIDYLANETAVRACCVFTLSEDPDAAFIGITLPRIKFTGITRDDGEKGIIQSAPFTALKDTTVGPNSGTGATDSLATTISIQDSAIA